MMPEQSREHVRRSERGATTGEVAADAGAAAVATVSPEAAAKADALKAEMDDTMSEIDAILEENAEAFVGAYLQKGGQ